MPRRKPKKKPAGKPDPVIKGSKPAVERVATPGEGLPFPVVGVGASAGGVEALSRLFSAMPTDTGMAFVIVQHLAPTHESLLTKILGRATRMPVREAGNNLRVKPDRVYVIPPGKALVIRHGLLKLAPRKEARGQHRPIDHFLRSLAEESGHKAIGVVLSGTANDGTLGIEAVKAAGGITFAQDDSAEQTSMPRSAVAAGCVDFVLPPDEIAREIGRISSHPHVKLLADGLEASPGEPSVGRVLELLQHSTGVNLAPYKLKCMHRRITRRMVLHKLDSLSEYVRMLQANPVELEALYQDVLISVTSFFRNPEVYETLKTSVFAALTADRSPQDQVRLWALGCSTGEEAYSVAMAFTEYIEAAGKPAGMQVFGTDLNGAAIEKARAGLYTRGITQDLSPERLRRFFIEVDGGYRICQPIRDMCVFARHNVLADPPFSRIDLVACRNMLICLEPELQQKLIPILHYSLRPTGCLWLGGSEALGSYHDLFELQDAKNKIYSKKPSGRISISPLSVDRSPPPYPIAARPARPEPRTAVLDPQKVADRLLLARYAPAGVVVNEDLDIVQFRGDTSPFLMPAPGHASLNLLKMLREGLLAAVSRAVNRARREDVAVREEGLRVESTGGYRAVNVVVLPLKGSSLPDGCVLVLFEEPVRSAETRARGLEAETRVDVDVAPRAQKPEASEKDLARLKLELAATREYLQSVIEQQEAANEELQSANEELQSLNEELETSKEEIQSSNEELATVNDEFQNRYSELTQSNNDLTNLLASVQMAIVMLGPDRRIRRFTPASEKLLNLIPTDIGRPLSDIRMNISVPDLDQMILKATDTLSVEEREVEDKNGRWFSLRVRPYRTLENKIDGAVLMLIDVDNLKRAERALRESEARFEVLADSSPVPIWVNGLEGCQTVNRAFEEFLGVLEPDIRGFDWTKFIHPEDRDDYVSRYQDAFQRRARFETEFRFRRFDGAYRWMKTLGTPRFVPGGEFLGYVGCNYDITDMKEAEAMLRQLDRSKDEFLAMLAHELRNPLASMRNASHLLATGGNDREVIATAQAVIDRQTQNMVRLVDDLLDVSRITHGKIQLRNELVDLSAAVRHAVSATEHHCRQRGQELTLVLPAEPLHVRGDTARLDQIFGNLLINASKFTQNLGHVWITVESEAIPAPSAIVRIRDDGVGIEPALLTRIFDLFVQVYAATGDQPVGLGIGLTLAKRLTELHGGSIEAHSPGLSRGSEFVVRLPLAPEGAHADALPAEGDAPSSTKPCRVLVVDDNVDAADSQSILLKLAGHDVRAVNDGQSALKVAAEFLPEVILLDIGMPGEDGYHVARRLREELDLKDTLIVALTGHSRLEDVEKSRASGFDEHLTKPVDPERVLGMITRRAPRK
ncbi:MAG TPA: chemotaxis protein CheB [Planctomycetota bacterium]|nr:chemotaxis protein CheB [Planctomycetota bacterium]